MLNLMECFVQKKELEISDDHNGIIELPEKYKF